MMLKVAFLLFGLLAHAALGAKWGLYDGVDVEITKHPYQVSVYVSDLASGRQCDGVIIGDSWVLLQAWCIKGASKGDIEVFAGGSKSGTKYSVASTATHPQYYSKGIRQNFDYGLIQISGSFSFSDKVAKVNLPSKGLSAGSTLTVSAFKAPYTNDVVQEGEMSVISNSECKKLWSTYSQSFTTQMGCLYNKGKTTFCTTNNGSPAVKDNTVYYLMNRSDPKGCTSSSIPTILADVVPAVSWITKISGIKA